MEAGLPVIASARAPEGGGQCDAKTDAGQVLKYAALLAMEELLTSKPKERLGLLYIVLCRASA